MALSMAGIIMVVITLKHTIEEDSFTPRPNTIITPTTPDFDDDDDNDEDDQMHLNSPLPIPTLKSQTSSPDDKDYDDQIHLSRVEENVILFVVIAIAVFVGLILVANISTFVRCIKSLIFSQRKHLQSTIAKLELVKSEGYLQVFITIGHSR